MGFLNPAVDYADGRRVSVGRGRCGKPVGGSAPGPPCLLWQGDILGLDDLKDVGIVENEVFETFAEDPEPNREAVRKDGGIEWRAIDEVQNFGLVELRKLCRSPPRERA